MDLFILLKSSVRYIKWGEGRSRAECGVQLYLCVLKDTEVSNSGRY